MAFIANTAFELKVTNASRNGTQNVAGMYMSAASPSGTATDCSAGFLVVQDTLIPSQGYTGISNGNTWYFITATSGAVGNPGDHTGIYACNTYDVNKVTNGNLQFNLGAQTLGLGLPAGNIGDFTELIVGEQIKVGVGNFSATPTAGYKYATIANGLWTAVNAAPATEGAVYGQILRTEPFNEGSSFWGTGYVIKICRIAVQGGE